MLFIFDWDGTLSDSTAKIVGCMQEAAGNLSLPSLAPLDVQEIIGLGLPEAIRRLYPELSEADCRALGAEYRRCYVVADQTPSDFFPGVLETLDVLRASGNRLSVATGKSRKGLDRVLSQLELSDYFDATRCADETASKPDPLMLHELLSHFGCVAQDAVMVGDTEYDMAMADAAQVPRVAVSFGAHHIDRLRTYEPVLCLDAMPQILALAK